ncbi:vanillate O-demethylase ferredoxin subunit [Natronocella acetinitrilica]|jgi:vanillate monooxygenase ferredoxin subunit|uniref:Vanillate O-demethylase ferredoxin subunit n=1 Tax=Natronocella acetinitrilica TaxID=414046 RepID=A0AAE3G4H4_9GAMM|nr:PDR/VanB family oxidoreductase [Natronocella acetinitrilica]MCP1675670.1 vanillate O-demethylase ferredoxin subunit [Natronocella acetinitrilica]
MAVSTSTETLKVRVAKVTPETDTIKRFELVALDGGELPAFTAGAHVNVITDAGMARSYSLANDPTERSRYLLGVLREPESRGGSEWMHESVSEGMELEITLPRNNFELREDGRSHVLIAGGVGITPLLSMAHRLKAIGAEFTLHYCTKFAEQTAFREEVSAVCGDRAVFHHDGGDPDEGIQLEQVLMDPPEDGHLYVCGPGGLLQATRMLADAFEWPEEHVHFELFSAQRSGDELSNDPFTVYLQKSERELEVPADKTLLQVLREAGYEIESFCEEGICSTCETAVVSGNIEHRDDVLSDDEKACNDRMMVCVSRAPAGERVVLDL